MQINLTKEQFKEMLLAAMLYSWICGSLAEGRGEDFSKYEKLTDYLLKIANDEEMFDLVENFEGNLVPSDELAEEEGEIMDKFGEDEFWERLVRYLGKRDFYRDMTKEEKREAKKNNWLPERVHEFYERYNKEFEEYGVERLEVKK